jgi:hypothetical protein
MCLPLFRCPVCLNVYMKPRGAYVENTCIDHIISDRLTKVWVYVTYTLTCTLVLRTVRTSRTRLGFRSLRSLRAFRWVYILARDTSHHCPFPPLTEPLARFIAVTVCITTNIIHQARDIPPNPRTGTVLSSKDGFSPWFGVKEKGSVRRQHPQL